MDDFINNNDTDGLLTFAFIGKDADVVDHDFDIASKEDTIIHHPKLIFNMVATAIDDKNIAMVDKYGGSQLYNRAMDELNLDKYTQLMKSNQDGEKMVFLKREWTPNDKEFLMLNGNKLINIRGDINIMHLYEFEDILSSIGEILEFEIPY